MNTLAHSENCGKDEEQAWNSHKTGKGMQL
jgi:hypothetical protein